MSQKANFVFLAPPLRFGPPKNISDKYATKSAFWGDLGMYISRKFRNNAHFFEVFEIHLPRPPKLHLLRCRDLPPNNHDKDWRSKWWKITVVTGFQLNLSQFSSTPFLLPFFVTGMGGGGNSLAPMRPKKHSQKGFKKWCFGVMSEIKVRGFVLWKKLG